ncbi:MAG: nicotinate phosphoribosyltransferase, partial [Gemmatimonadetes bacterium]|nr:nicotinate phosphoribosyltransferase [Gemmatimonadota bacterium]
FEPGFLDWLEHLRFTGTVRAMREGTPVFGEEPILEVIAPLPEAQLAESVIMNQVHLQTVLASKAARVVTAARGRAVVDFGLRRIHGTDAALKAARAFYVAGVSSTSNVLAGQTYGIPLAGTMAHSYVQAHDSELDAFRAFTRIYPDTVLLVDTYDTLEGVRRVIQVAQELGEDFQVRAVRLDSGDLAELAFGARALLDGAGLQRVGIFASGGLDEYEIHEMLERGAPIDAFGVGTRMGASSDAPALDMAYKLTSYAGRGRLKLSTGKPIWPGPKQVFREHSNGRFVRDVIASADEHLPGEPLLDVVMRGGVRLTAGKVSLEQARAHAASQIAALPDRARALTTADPPYEVAVSDHLEALRRQLALEESADEPPP